VKSIRKDIKNVKKGVKYILQKKDIINNILSKIMPDNSNIGPILIDNFCPILAIDCFFNFGPILRSQFLPNIGYTLFFQYWANIGKPIIISILICPILRQYWRVNYAAAGDLVHFRFFISTIFCLSM